MYAWIQVKTTQSCHLPHIQRWQADLTVDAIKTLLLDVDLWTTTVFWYWLEMGAFQSSDVSERRSCLNGRCHLFSSISTCSPMNLHQVIFITKRQAIIVLPQAEKWAFTDCLLPTLLLLCLKNGLSAALDGCFDVLSFGQSISGW